LLRGMAAHYEQSMEARWNSLPEDFKQKLLHGTGAEEVEFTFWRAGKMSKAKRRFEGVMPNLERLYAESESEFARNRLKGFMNPRFCDACGGRRLKPEALAVTIGDAIDSAKFRTIRAKSEPKLPGLSIMDLCGLSIEEADDFLEHLK